MHLQDERDTGISVTGALQRLEQMKRGRRAVYTYLISKNFRVGYNSCSHELTNVCPLIWIEIIAVTEKKANAINQKGVSDASVEGSKSDLLLLFAGDIP